MISRAKSEVSVPKRKGSPTINEDGSLSYKTADDLTYVDKKTGKTKTRTQASTQMAEAKDARTLPQAPLRKKPMPPMLIR